MEGSLCTRKQLPRHTARVLNKLSLLRHRTIQVCTSVRVMNELSTQGAMTTHDLSIIGEMSAYIGLQSTYSERSGKAEKLQGWSCCLPFALPPSYCAFNATWVMCEFS